MASLLTRILLIELCISLVIFLSGVNVLDDTNNNFINNFINVDSYNNDNQLQTKGTTFAQNTNSTSQGLEKTSGGLLSFIDVVSSIVSFLKFLLTLLFLPVYIMASIGLPNILCILIGVPLTFLNVLGFIYLIRSGS